MANGQVIDEWARAIEKNQSKKMKRQKAPLFPFFKPSARFIKHTFHVMEERGAFQFDY